MFNPFDKPIDKPKNKTDLRQLIKNQVAEGYYVEYKSDFPENIKIARSIASFANTYGGWYIIGIKTDQHNVAKNICGFTLKKVHDPISKVRELIKTCIDPIPVFFTEIVELGSDLAVLIIHIPPEQEMPFVTSDGRIYRRVSDSSSPTPEQNRYAIDKLYENGQKVRKDFERICDGINW